MAQRQTTLNDFDTTEVRTEEQTTEEVSIREDARLFQIHPDRVPQHREKIRAAGIEVEVARRVERKMDREIGRFDVFQATEAEQEYLEAKNSLDVQLGADYAGLNAGGSL